MMRQRALQTLLVLPAGYAAIAVIGLGLIALAPASHARPPLTRGTRDCVLRHSHRR
jgi:hypothetical protein